MSILLVTEAFKADLPCAQKFVLVAVCDSANDQGECYPSVETLASKCSLTVRAVQMALRAITSAGFLNSTFRAGRSTVYTVNNPSKWPKPLNDVHPISVATPEPRSPLKEKNPRTTFTPESHSPLNDVHHGGEGRSGGGEGRSPITVTKPSSNQKTQRRTLSAESLVSRFGVSEQVANDWLAVRKAKRAALTETAMADVEREATKAGLTVAQAIELCAARSWQGFKASWVTTETRRPNEKPHAGNNWLCPDGVHPTTLPNDDFRRVAYSTRGC